MNTRAIYWATRSIIEVVRWLAGIVGLMFYLFLADEQPWQARLTGLLILAGLTLWAGADMRTALKKLKNEANTDTALGLNGPRLHDERIIP